MKKIIAIGFILAGVPAFAQKIPSAKVPDAVKTAFHKNFEGIKEADWEKEKGNYEANFKQDGQKVSATFDKNGVWLETEKRISANALPADANKYIETHNNSKPVHGAYIITKANGETCYEARLQGKDYIFDAQGKFLKIEKD